MDSHVQLGFHDGVAEILMWLYKDKDIGFLVGQGMKALKGRGNPASLARALRKLGAEDA